MQRRIFLLVSATALIGTTIAKAMNKMERVVKNGFVVRSGTARSGKRYAMKGVTLNMLDIKLSAEDTNGAIAMFEQTGLTPNGGPPLHIHPEQDEWFYVLEGNYRFRVGDDTHLLGQGDTIFLPRGIPHAFIQLSEKAKVIVTYQPAGKMQEFFATTDQWASPPSKEEVERVFEANGMKVVGPPLK